MEKMKVYTQEEALDLTLGKKALRSVMPTMQKFKTISLVLLFARQDNQRTSLRSALEQMKNGLIPVAGFSPFKYFTISTKNH